MATVSGYGRIAHVPAEDAELTRVGFATPMGELLRRYWQPVCLSAEIDELPKFTKILGEELVAFRDKRLRNTDTHAGANGGKLGRVTVGAQREAVAPAPLGVGKQAEQVAVNLATQIGFRFCPVSAR